jgi:transposase-like protein
MDDDDRVPREPFERDVILWGVAAYPISYRRIEEMMGERGVEVDRSTLHRWVSNMRRLWPHG